MRAMCGQNTALPGYRKSGISPDSLHLGDHAAGDSGPCISRGIALHIVGHGVDYDGRAAVAEDRMRIIAHGYAGRDDRSHQSPLRPHSDVRHVTGVRALRILQTVMLHVRIEVAAGRCERRSLALRHRVNVNPVHARWKTRQIEANAHALWRGRKFRRADAIALPVVQLRLDRLLRRRGKGR
jgi:hypothetical protein